MVHHVVQAFYTDKELAARERIFVEGCEGVTCEFEGGYWIRLWVGGKG